MHGDFWVNNMMFRLNEHGVPKYVKFIDLQVHIPFLTKTSFGLNVFIP